jgi:non-ribosomal peptide synthetase component F
MQTPDAEPLLLHEFFARAVARWPDRTAIDVPPGNGRRERRTLTYDELDRQSDALARRLSAFVAGECVVAVMLPRRTAQLYVAQLATLKSGAAYACIDPSMPDGQVRDILADSEAVALLTDDAGARRASQVGFDNARILNITDQSVTNSTARDETSGATNGATSDATGDATISAFVEAAPPSSSLAPTPWLTPHSLAYVIYTSGTTGRPKGVMIEHASISNLIASDVDEFALSPADRVAQSSSSSFDSSVEEVWLALSMGATLVVLDEEAARLGPDLIDWLRREHVTVVRHRRCCARPAAPTRRTRSPICASSTSAARLCRRTWRIVGRAVV